MNVCTRLIFDMLVKWALTVYWYVCMIHSGRTIPRLLFGWDASNPESGWSSLRLQSTRQMWLGDDPTQAKLAKHKDQLNLTDNLSSCFYYLVLGNVPSWRFLFCYPSGPSGDGCIICECSLRLWWPFLLAVNYTVCKSISKWVKIYQKY